MDVPLPFRRPDRIVPSPPSPKVAAWTAFVLAGATLFTSGLSTALSGDDALAPPPPQLVTPAPVPPIPSPIATPSTGRSTAATEETQQRKREKYLEIERQLQDLSRSWKERLQRQSPPVSAPPYDRPLPLEHLLSGAAPPEAAERSSVPPAFPVEEPSPNPLRSQRPESLPSATDETPLDWKPAVPPGTPVRDSGTPIEVAAPGSPGADTLGTANVMDPAPPDDTSNAAADLPTETLNGPIDRLALSSSLYATGDFELCLKILNAIDPKQLSPMDGHWVHYLKAGCHRRLGRNEEARHWYRRIVAAQDSDWIGQMARWWLDEIQERESLQAESVKLQATVAQWRAELDALSTELPTTTPTGTP